MPSTSDRFVSLISADKRYTQFEFQSIKSNMQNFIKKTQKHNAP